MHKLVIPQSVVDRVVARHGREHIHDDLDPKKTALVVVDMQNAFMLPGVAHAPCPMAEKIVPNINQLAEAVREVGGTVVWIKTTTPSNTSKLVDALRHARARQRCCRGVEHQQQRSRIVVNARRAEEDLIKKSRHSV